MEAKRQSYPSISREVLEAVIKASRDRDRLAVVHIDNLISAEHAVQAGASGLVHTFMDALVSDELITLMKEGNVFVIPTLSVLASVVGDSAVQALANDPDLQARMNGTVSAALNAQFPDFGIPADAFELALENTRLMHAAGIPVLAGTDAPNPGTAHGVSLHGELSLLVRAGLSNEAALGAATSGVAEAFALDDRGQISAGRIADLVLVDGNPLEDITASRRIIDVWKNGRRLTASDAATGPVASVPPDHGMISDFTNDQLSTRFGRGFQATTDQMMNGKSTAEISWLNLGEEQGGALKVSGELKSGFSFPWSGAYFVAVESEQEMLDLSRKERIQFRARGSAGRYRLMLFSHGMGRPFETSFEVSEDWTQLDIPLKQIQGVDLGRITGIAWVKGLPFDKFELVLDDIFIQ
jgi:hypothetical protein